MQLSVTFRHMEATDAIKDYAKLYDLAIEIARKVVTQHAPKSALAETKPKRRR